MSKCVVQIFQLPHEDAASRDSDDSRYAYTVTSHLGSRSTKLARANRAGLCRAMSRLGISENEQTGLLNELDAKRNPASETVELSDEIATEFGCTDS